MLNTSYRQFAAAWLLPILPLAAQQLPVWTQQLVVGPSPRYSHCMAFDASRGVTWLFGGDAGTGPRLADTWAWNGATWTQSQVTGPPGRSGAAMAFDLARQQMILFGGDYYLADTWAWNGQQWMQLSPAQAPVARRGHSMAYDAVRQVIVLFGGERSINQRLGDTWEWDGVGWTPRFSAHVPSPRSLHGMAYDEVRQQIVVFGGGDRNGFFDDTWTWDGVDWTLRAATTRPSARQDFPMVWLRSRQVVTLFHGSTTSSFADVWFWDGSNWTDQSRSSGSPLGRHAHAMAYDAASDAVVMFGGVAQIGTQADTWLLTVPGVTGRCTPLGQGCGGLSLGAAVGSLPRLGRAFAVDLLGLPAAVGAFASLGWSSTFAGPFPLPLSLAFAGMPGCTLYQDLAVPMLPMVLGAGSARLSLTVPASPALAGMQFFVQGGAQVPGSNPAGLLVSNAVEVTVGN